MKMLKGGAIGDCIITKHITIQLTFQRITLYIILNTR